MLDAIFAEQCLIAFTHEFQSIVRPDSFNPPIMGCIRKEFLSGLDYITLVL